MKMNKYCHILCFVIFSCSTIVETDSLQQIKLTFKDNNSIAIEAFADSMRIIKLECPNNDAIVSKIDRVLFCDDKMLVVGIKSNLLSLFTEDGKFVKSTVSIIGHGHNEYVSLKDAALDEYDKRIYVLTDVPRKLFVFDYDLNVIQSYDMDNRSIEIGVDSTHLYFLCLSDDQMSFDVRTVEKTNPEAEQTVLLSNSKICPFLFTFGQSMNICNRQCYVSMPFDNKIYHLNKGKVVGGYCIDFGDNWFTYVQSKGRNTSGFERINQKKYWSIKNIMVSDSCVLFSSNKSGIFILNKESSHGMVYTWSESQQIPFISIFMTPIQGRNNKIAYCAFSEDIQLFNEKLHNKEYTKSVDSNVIRIVERCEESDNPLIIVWNLK